jgi:putative ABC transport system permease protein
LLIAAGLLLESLRRIERDDVGFRTGGRVALDISLAGPSYSTDAQRAARFRQIIDRVSDAPGVRTAALVRTLPLAPELTALNSFGIEGHAVHSAQDLPSAFQRPITPAYFETMGIPMLRGRAFTTSDDERAPLVAIIDSAAIRRFWPGEDPLGKRVYYDRRVGRLWLTVVGVVGSVKHTRTSTVPEPTLYVPLPQWPMSEMTIVAQTALSPTALILPIAAAVRSTDPELPVSNARTLDAVAAQAVWRPRFATVLLSAFAATALLLATLGIYGVTSYNVTQRRSEMALRIALGAQPSQVSAMVLGRSARLGAVGVGIGLALAALTTRFMSGLLYATPAFDLSIYVTVALLLGAVSVAAGLVPALRAARVNLGDVLRAE